MTSPNHVALIISQEIARWAVSFIIGLCITFWSMILTIIIVPSVLNMPTSRFLGFFSVSALFTSVASYLIFARHLGHSNDPI